MPSRQRQQNRLHRTDASRLSNRIHDDIQASARCKSDRSLRALPHHVQSPPARDHGKQHDHRRHGQRRDEGAEQRLEILDSKEGVWRCRTTFNCTDACPRGIEVTKAIQEVKRALIYRG